MKYKFSIYFRSIYFEKIKNLIFIKNPLCKRYNKTAKEFFKKIKSKFNVPF